MLQHQFKAETKKDWLRRKLASNEPVSLDELIAGEKLWKAIGYSTKRGVLRQLQGHSACIRHETKAPAVPRGEWHEDADLGRKDKVDGVAVPCYLTSKGFKLLLQVAPSDAGQAWRLYLVEAEQYLKLKLSQDTREELAESHVSTAATLFGASFDVSDVAAIKGQAFTRLYGQHPVTVNKQIKEKKGLRAQPKNINKWNHASDSTNQLQQVLNSSLAFMATPGLTTREVSMAAADQTFAVVRAKEKMTGETLIHRSPNGSLFVPFEIREGKAIDSRAAAKRREKERDRKKQMEEAKAQQLSISD